MSRLINDLKTDCDNLIKSYVELNTTSYLDFLSLWKAKHFDVIYAGQGENDIDYFIFHVIHVAKSNCAPAKSKFERVAGLYLVYLLYYTQPLKVKKRIRVVPDEFVNLKDLAEEFKSENKEVSYAFYKLLLENAFDFVVTALPYDENLFHYKEEMKAQNQSVAEVETPKANLSDIIEESDFNKAEWLKLMSDYNASKQKINNCSSLNFELTKSLGDL